MCSNLTSEGINLTLADIQKCSIALLLNQSGAQSFAEMHSSHGSKQLCFFGNMLWCFFLVKDFDFFFTRVHNLQLSTLENSAGH